MVTMKKQKQAREYRLLPTNSDRLPGDGGIVDALKFDPADPLNWAVYADFLDDNSCPRRAGFIRKYAPLALALLDAIHNSPEDAEEASVFDAEVWYDEQHNRTTTSIVGEKEVWYAIRLGDNSVQIMTHPPRPAFDESLVGRECFRSRWGVGTSVLNYFQAFAKVAAKVESFITKFAPGEAVWIAQRAFDDLGPPRPDYDDALQIALDKADAEFGWKGDFHTMTWTEAEYWLRWFASRSR